MIEYVLSRINDTYPIVLPDFRHTFHAERPWWERGRLDSCAELMTPGMTVFDIGAEHGDFTALYKQWVGPTGDVIPIEPANHYWQFIRDTWSMNELTPQPSMSFVGLVGATEHGDRPLDDGWPYESELPGTPDGGFVHLRHSPDFNRTCIDMLACYERPDAIVIDIEGAEFDALSGAGHVLSEIRPLVWVSVHDVGDGLDWPGPLKAWYGKTPDDIHALMDGYGYTAELLPSHGEGESFWLYRP